MIRHRSRQRVDAFNGVETIHHAAGYASASSIREATPVTDILRVGQERIRIERENHRRFIEPEQKIDVAANGLLQSREAVLVADGVVGRPLQLRIFRAQLGHEARERGRRERFRKDREAGAAIRGMSLGQLAPRRHEIGPGLRFALQPDGLRSIGIVEAKHGCLDARARRTERRRVRGVSLDLGRPSLVALDDHTVRAAAERHRRGVEARDAGDDVFGRVDVGDDVLDRTPDDVAPGKAGDRHRGAQQRDHVAPGDP